MENSIVIWRPFVGIEQSVMSLEPRDISLVGKLHLSKVILSILSKLKLIEPTHTNIIENNENVQWYWNNGKPFLHDLVYYYKASRHFWREEGGDDVDWLEDYWDIIEDCEFYSNKGKWLESMGLTHKLLLIHRHRFWYKRHWMYLKDHRLKQRHLTVDNKPRKITKSSLSRETFHVPEVKK